MWKGELEDLTGLKKGLRCIKYEVKKRPPKPPAVQEPDLSLEPSEVTDLREEVATFGSSCR
jgi:hypothetical protein